MPAPRRRHSAASSLRCVLGGLLLCAALAGCGSDEGRLDAARDSVREALARQDIAGLQQALSELRAVPAETPEEVLAVSSLMMRAGETAHAVWILEAALARHPERHDLRIRLARGVLVVGDLPRVRGVLEPVEPASEFHLAALLLRARVELDAGDLDAGLALLVEAETRYPDSPQAGLARVSTLLQEDRVDEARAAVEQAIRSAGSEERGQQLAVVAAGIEITHGDADSGIARLHDLVAANPLDAELRGTLAQGLQLAGRIEEAVELIREGLLLDPGQPALFAILAQAELAAGRPSAAEEALLGMIVLADSPSARYLLARVRIFDGRKQDAAETLREAAERFSETPMLRMHEAEAWIDLGLLGRALEAFDSFRRAAPGDPHVDYLGARMALANGDPHRAARDLLGVVSRLDRAYTQFTLGQALEAMGDLSGAERRFGLALLRDTRHPAPAAALIRLAESRGDWEMASNYALQLVARAPGNPQAHATLVAAFTRARQPKRAEAAARFYAQRFPARADAAALLAMTLRAQRRYPEAEAVLADAGARLGRSPHFIHERAVLLGDRGEFAEGLRVLDEAIEALPEEARFQASKAALAFAAGRAELGDAAVEYALALDADYIEVLALRATYRASVGEFEAAQRDAERYLEARPRDAAVLFMLGVIHQRRGQGAEAAAAYRRATELDANSFAAQNNLALLLVEQGEIEEAVQVANRAYARAEDDPQVIGTLGWVYLHHGLVDRSVALLERAHAMNPGSADTQLHLALAYRKAGRAEAARGLLAGLVEHSDARSETRERASATLRGLGE